jgi:phage terminase small subunit
MKLEPEDYLTEGGRVYFYRICEHIKGKTEAIDSLEISMLAQTFQMYKDAVDEGNRVGFVNVFENGTIQINGYQTIMDKAYATILKHSPKFGLNATDRAKIASNVKPVKTKKTFA